MISRRRRILALIPALAFLALVAAPGAKAATITITSGDVAPVLFSPAADSLSFFASSGTFSGPGTITFQRGNFYIGNSAIPDQNILFSFVMPITINGITQNITVSGEDDVTASADTLFINAGAPVSFGGTIFTLRSFTSAPGVVVDSNIPISLDADLTPEPASIVLLATGIICFAFFIKFRSRRIFGASQSNSPEPTMAKG